MTAEESQLPRDEKALQKLLKTELKMVQTRISELREIICDFERTEETIQRSLDHLESKQKGDKEGLSPITSLKLSGITGEFVYEPVVLSKGLWEISAKFKGTSWLTLKFKKKGNDSLIYEHFKQSGNKILVQVDKPVRSYPTINASSHDTWSIEMRLAE